MRNVAGLSTSEAQKSSDMFMKCRYMDEITGGRGVIFATGTPVSNSMTELYTVMRYLQYDTLQQKKLTHLIPGHPPLEKLLLPLSWLPKNRIPGKDEICKVF